MNKRSKFDVTGIFLKDLRNVYRALGIVGILLFLVMSYSSFHYGYRIGAAFLLSAALFYTYHFIKGIREEFQNGTR